MKNTSIQPPQGSRYRALIVFITIFVLSIVSVLALNFYISFLFNKDALEINIAGRQRMLSQKMTKSLLDLQVAQQTGVSVENPLSELKSSYDLFNDSINAFDRGGETLDTLGNRVNLDAVASAKTRSSVNEGQSIWKKYQENILPLIEQGSTEPQTLSDANKLVLTQNVPLLDDMNDLTLSLQSEGAEGQLINLAGRQRLLSQKIAKDLFQLGISANEQEQIVALVADLKKSVNLFDKTLSAFSDGGETSSANGETITIDRLEYPTAQEIIRHSNEIWQPMRIELLKLLSDSDFSMMPIAVNTALENNLDLLSSMNGLTTSLQIDSEKRSGILRIIQILGIAISLIMFSIILFYFLRQLRNSDSELETAKAETDRIMDTVNDGLFLLDKDYNIGLQHSTSIVDIFARDDLAGRSFLSVLRKMVPEKTLEVAEQYFTLLFGDRVYEELVTDLNPLDVVEVHLDNNEGRYSTKYLQFEFKRVLVDENVSHLLVQVDDITKQVILEQELEKSQESANRQLDLMMKVLHVEPDLLASYLNDTESSLREINQVLSASSSKINNRDKIDQMFRTMHAIKGDASALELDVFAERAHKFENELATLRGSSNVGGIDFLPLTISLDEFLSQVESLKEIFERMGGLREAVSSGEGVDENNALDTLPITNKLMNFTNNLSKKRGKLAVFSLFGESELPEEYQSDISEILTQLVRNSLVHGIETPQTRIDLNKPAQGSIRTFIQKGNDDGLEIRFHDDGQGLSPEAIKKVAVAKGIISQHHADKMDAAQAISLIFKSGFSSTDTVDEDAGRGVGMDVIRNRVTSLGGNIRVRFSEGKFSEFMLSIPASA